MTLYIKISRRVVISNIPPITIPVFARAHAVIFGQKI